MDYYQQHKDLLDDAIKAIHDRKFWTPYPEHHKAYDLGGIERSQTWLKGIQGKNYDVLHVEASSYDGNEVSRLDNLPLGVSYPVISTETLILKGVEARKRLADSTIEERSGLLLEVLYRLKKHYFELGIATQHCNGQSFMMAFQGSGPHAMDRALEALALTFSEQKRFPKEVLWEKPMGKSKVTLEKTFRPVSKGIGLVIGCSTFPIWNAIAAVFANIQAGNPVIWKPHSQAVLPVALVINEIRKVFHEAGNAEVVQLALDSREQRALELANAAEVNLIDYTGNTPFGDRLEGIPNKTVFTEKSGVNGVLIHTLNDVSAVIQNIAFSCVLFSGQMCTSPQVIYVPQTIETEEGLELSGKEFSEQLITAIQEILSNPKIGKDTAANLHSDELKNRLNAFDSDYELIGEATHPFKIKVHESTDSLQGHEIFGPMLAIVKVENAELGLSHMAKFAAQQGAISASVYTTVQDFQRKAELQMELAGVGVSFNLTGYIWVNQASGFSDFHVSGANPAGNASLVSPDFCQRRFAWIGHRINKQNHNQ